MEPRNIPCVEEIESFLYNFRALKEKFGMVIYDRKKNLKALLDLEITAIEREKILDNLTARDYYKGPQKDGVNIGAEYWEFGTTIKGTETYIKISKGLGNQAVACLSFHPAERRIKYPFK
ncbi:MAG: toxin [Bacteroidia bacterium]|nr:toxin [Bacteroidia bacterium]